MQEGQEGFDKVTRHLLTQGEKAIDEDGYCQYRTSSGLKCAMGCLMSDKDITKCGVENSGMLTLSMAGRTPDNWWGYLDIINPLGLTKTMLNGLQFIHDDPDPKYWHQDLHSFAKLHNFTFNPPQTQAIF